MSIAYRDADPPVNLGSIICSYFMFLRPGPLSFMGYVLFTVVCLCLDHHLAPLSSMEE